MEIKTIRKSIEIDAPRETVWNVMLDDDSYRSWTEPFCPGSYADTDWKEGSKVIFSDGAGSGMVGRIVVSRFPEKVSVEYTGVLMNDEEDADSDFARALRGTHETYILTENGNGTLLSIESDMTADYFDSMSEAWDKALLRIRELAEEEGALSRRSGSSIAVSTTPP